MADNDEKNKKEGLEESPPNVDSPLLARLREIAAQNRPGAAEEEDRRKAEIAHKGIGIFSTLTPDAAEYGPIAALHKKNLQTKSRLEPKIRIKEESRQKALAARATNEVARDFSEESINGEVTKQAATPETQLAATSMMNVPYDDLIKQQRQKMGRLQEIGSEQKELASDLILRKISDQDKYPGMKEKSFEGIKGNVEEADKIKGELAKIAAVLQQQKAQGLDPKSRMQDLYAKGEQAKDIVKDVELKKEIETGTGLGGMSADELKTKEAKAAEDLVRALNDLKGATEDQKKDKQQDAERAASDLDKVQAAIAAGAGGAKPPSGRDSFMSYAGIAQAGFGAAANAIQQIGVNQKLAQAQNAAGYAGFENQKYQTYKAAAAGDVASLMQLSQFEGAEDFGGGLKTAANISVGAQLAAGVTQTAMGVVDVASTLNPAENALATSGAQAHREAGIKTTMEGVATSAVAGMDLYRGVSAGQADLAGRQARLEVSRSINAIGAEQVQGFRDYSVGLGTASIGMGAAGEGFLNRMNDVGIEDKRKMQSRQGMPLEKTMLERMGEARIGPEQMAQMAQSGAASMGSMFNENQIFAARGAEARGFGTMQENMSRMSTLAAAGSNDPQASLAGVMEVAFTRGLDSSKALNAVVEHTASMASASSGRAMGVDTTAAAATLLTSTMDKNNPNKEAALERAASVQDAVKNISTNTNVSYAGMVATTRTMKMSGVDRVSGQILQGMDIETLKTLQQDPNARERLMGKGVDVRGKDVNKVLAGALGSKQLTLEEGGGVGFALPMRNKINPERIASKLSKGEKLTDEETLYQGQVSSLGPMRGTGAELSGAVVGVTAKIDKTAAKGTEALTMPAADDKSVRTSLDKLRTIGFEQLTGAAAAAATNLGGAAAAVHKLTAAFENLEKSIPKTESKATTAAGAAASGEKGLNVDVAKFNGSIDKLDRVLNSVLSKQGLGSGTSMPDNKQKISVSGS